MCLVEELNNFFVHVAGTSSIDVPSVVLNTSQMNDFDDSKVYWKHISPQSIKVISKIKTNAAGCDGISLSIICLTMSYIMPVIKHIFNFFLSHGIFPYICSRMSYTKNQHSYSSTALSTNCYPSCVV